MGSRNFSLYSSSLGSSFILIRSSFSFILFQPLDPVEQQTMLKHTTYTEYASQYSYIPKLGVILVPRRFGA